MPKIISTEQFIEKANNIHNNFYAYYLTHYINNSTKVCIICPIHGDFWQIPSNHLRGHGCPDCGETKISKLKKNDITQFTIKAILIHGDKYDYSKAFYVNSWTKITITCPKHGDFDQTPNNHLKGKGCPKCKVEKLKSDRKLTLQQFIEKAHLIHGDNFDYSRSVFINYHTKLIIKCPLHGDFEQTPNGHLQGQGCPICRSSKGEILIASILDKYNIKKEREYKLPELVSNYEYDFYLPDYRILIEFHGEQHYKYIPFFHRYDEDNFLKQKERDILKKDHAYRFKYRFLEFNYKQLKYMTLEQFEEMIVKKLKFSS